MRAKMARRQAPARMPTPMVACVRKRVPSSATINAARLNRSTIPHTSSCDVARLRLGRGDDSSQDGGPMTGQVKRYTEHQLAAIATEEDIVWLEPPSSFRFLFEHWIIGRQRDRRPRLENLVAYSVA